MHNETRLKLFTLDPDTQVNSEAPTLETPCCYAAYNNVCVCVFTEAGSVWHRAGREAV